MKELNTKSKVPALTRAAAIIDLVMERGKCTAREFMNELGLSKSSLYALLDELVNLNYLRKNEHGAYSLWVKLITLGDVARQSQDFRTNIMPYLEELVKETNCLASYFGIMSGENAYFMIKASNHTTAIETRSKESMPIDFLHSGIGKALLAFSPVDLQKRIISKLSFKKITENSIDNINDLQENLRITKERGWSFNDSEDDTEIRSIGVPVIDYNNNLIGAVSIVGTINRMSNSSVNELASITQRYATKVADAILF